MNRRIMIRRILFLLSCMPLLLSVSLSAQSSEATTEFDIAKIGYTNASDYGGGLMIGTELRHNPSPENSFGIRMDYMILGENNSLPPRGNLFDWDTVFFLGLTYLYQTGLDRDFGPMVGLSVGNYRGGGSNLEESSLGLELRFGYRVQYARFFAEYKYTVSDSLPNIFALTLGFPIQIGSHKSEIRDF